MLLALDVSLNSTGFAIFEGKEAIHYNTITNNKKDDEVTKRKYIQDRIIMILKKYDITEVVFEDTFFSSNVKTLKSLMVVHGIIIALINFQDIKYTYYTPQAIKKHELGKAVKGAKELIRKKLIKEYNLPEDTKDDITDALSLGRKHLNIK